MQERFYKKFRELPFSTQDAILSRQGVPNERFAQMKSRFLVEEYIWSDGPSIDYQGYISNGKHSLISQSHVLRHNNELSEDIFLDHIKSKFQDYSRERACWFQRPIENTDAIDVHKNLVEKLIEELQISNLVYSGPSYYVTDAGIRLIDFNPRVSGGHGLISKEFIFNPLVNVWKEWLGLPSSKADPIDKVYFWGVCHLKPGRIKNFIPPSLGEYVKLIGADFLGKDYVIQKHQSLQTKGYSVNLLIEASSLDEAIRTYHQAISQVQLGITYT
jgi:hypothetical protein